MVYGITDVHSSGIQARLSNCSAEETSGWLVHVAVLMYKRGCIRLPFCGLCCSYVYSRGVARIFQGGVQFAEILLTTPTF